VESPSVNVWARVNAVTCARSGFSRGLSRARPITNRMWSKPLGRMWLKPRPAKRMTTWLDPASTGAPASGKDRLSSPLWSTSVCVWAIASLVTRRRTGGKEREAKNVTSRAPAGTRPLRRARWPREVGGLSGARAVDRSGSETSNGAGVPSKRTRIRRLSSSSSEATSSSRVAASSASIWSAREAESGEEATPRDNASASHVTSATKDPSARNFR